MDSSATQPIAANARLRWAEIVPGSIKLSGSLEIETAATLRQVLLGLMADRSATPSELSGASLTVDLSEIEVCGTSGVQLLLSAIHTAAARGLTLCFLAPSSAIQNSFASFGMSDHLANAINTGAAIQ